MSTTRSTEGEQMSEQGNVQGLRQRVEELEAAVERLGNEFEVAMQVARNATDDADELAEKLSHERQRRKEIEKELEKVTDDRELLNTVRRNAAGDRQAQAAICIQSLTRQARKNANNRASMDANGCQDTLQGNIDRTNTYDVFEEAEQLVEDTEVVWYQKESRSSKKNSRLIVNLDGGSLPAQVAGVDLTEEATA